MQYLPGTNILCLEAFEMVPKIISEDNLRKSKSRGKIIVHGVGGNDRQRLIEFETLPPKYKSAVIATYGDPYSYHAKQPLLSLLKEDQNARRFYQEYRLEDGRPLPLKSVTTYSRQCDWLNMIIEVTTDKKTLKEELKISVKEFWENVIELYGNDHIDNGLPKSKRRLQDRITLYTTKGYEGLISAKYCNQNTRKVDSKIERLLLALYVMEEKPYLKTVCEYYEKFINGALDVVDIQTGELFNPQEFYVDGEPYKVKESTVKHYIENKPLNRAAVDKIRMSGLQYATKHRPHTIRKAPQFSFSKITMDDLTIPFVMANGDRVWSYQVFDVASQACIGYAFALRKDKTLIMEALRDMLRNILKNGYAMPSEIEVERHLTSDMKGKVDEAGVFKADVLTENSVFPFVRWCAPANPSEKRAEGFIKLKKYGHQKKRPGFQFRPFARLEVNRKNEDLKVVTYSYEDIVRNEIADITAYNNTLHTDQKKYNGLTRLQVLQQNINPELTAPNLLNILPYVGRKVETSVRRGYVQVRSKKYRLENSSMLERLNNDQVLAYYLTDEYGSVNDVYLYTEAEEPICKLIEIEGFQEAKVEATVEDAKILGQQKQYIAGFDALVDQRVKDMGKVAVVEKRDRKEVEVIAVEDKKAPVEVPVNGTENDSKAGGYMQENEVKPKPEDIKRRALRDI